MNKVDLSDGRIVYEEQIVELQNYIEQAIASQNPSWNDRVLHGLTPMLSSIEIDDKPQYTVKIPYGFGNSPKGFRVVLMEETVYEITEPEGGFPENPTLEFWLLPMKKPEGKWTDKKDEKHPERYLDSGYLVVTVRPKTEVENPSQPAVRALTVLRGQEYLGEFVDPSESDLLRLFALDLAQDESGVWTDSRYVAMIEDVAKPFLRMQEVFSLGSYHDQDIEHDLFESLNTWLSRNTRWRLAAGQELPADSKLRRQGKTNVPDLNNRFKRSWGGEAESLSRKIGDFQDHGLEDHSHISRQEPTSVEITSGGTYLGRDVGTQSEGDMVGSIKPTSANVANETRPVNIMVATFYLT